MVLLSSRQVELVDGWTGTWLELRTISFLTLLTTSVRSATISASATAKRSPARERSRLANTLVKRSCISLLFPLFFFFSFRCFHRNATHLAYLACLQYYAIMLIIVHSTIRTTSPQQRERESTSNITSLCLLWKVRRPQPQPQRTELINQIHTGICCSSFVVVVLLEIGSEIEEHRGINDWRYFAINNETRLRIVLFWVYSRTWPWTQLGHNLAAVLWREMKNLSR